MNIRVICPVTSRKIVDITSQQYIAAARPDAQISVVTLESGTPSIESRYERALAAPGVVARAIEAENQGIHAVVADCMEDPGVDEAREMVSIPVVGPAETAMHVAAMLGQQFSIVTVLDSLIPILQAQAAKIGLRSQLVSVRAVGIPVMELDNHARLLDAVLDQSIRAVEDDQAHVIVLGCTGMAGLAKDVEGGLRKRGINGVPVIDPGILALKIAEALADMGLCHSKRTYPFPPQRDGRKSAVKVKTQFEPHNGP